MNKKFFTLVLGVFLSVFAFTSANAQVLWLKNYSWKTGAGGVNAGALVPTTDEAVKIPESCGRFIIADPTGTNVLVMTEPTIGNYKIQWAHYDDAKVFESMWEVIPAGYKYGGMQFQFINVAHGMPMTIDLKTGVLGVAEEQIEFSWFTGTENLENGTGEGPKQIYVRTKNAGQFLALKLPSPLIIPGGPLQDAKTKTESNTTLNNGTGNQMELFNPRHFLLTANMLNELNGKNNGFSLSFNKEPLSLYKTKAEKNIFTATPLYAQQVGASSAVTLQIWNPKAQATQKYIKVDESYHNESGLALLRYNYTSDRGERAGMSALTGTEGVKLLAAIVPTGTAGTTPALDAAAPASLKFIDQTGAQILNGMALKAAIKAGDVRVENTLALIGSAYKEEAFKGDGTNAFFVDQDTYEVFKDRGIENVLFVTSIKERREFTFCYYPVKNALAIQIPGPGTAGFNGTANLFVPKGMWDQAYIDAPGLLMATPPPATYNAAIMAGVTAGFAYVAVRDLVLNTHTELTVADDAQNFAGLDLDHLGTVISPVGLGLGGCSNVITFEQFEEGLYFIEAKEFNGTGYTAAKQFVVPIQEDILHPGTSGAPQLIDKEPYHVYTEMPATQWIVKKISNVKNSRYEIFNREFPGTSVYPTAKWFQEVEGQPGFFAAFGSGKTPARIYKLTRIKEDKVLNDKYLGYFHLTDSAAKVDVYAFNYLTGLADNVYMNVPASGKDSTMFVKDDMKTWFRFDVLNEDVLYGATGTQLEDIDGNAICTQLMRNEYNVVIKDASKKTFNGRYMATRLVDGTYYKYEVARIATPLIPAIASQFILKLENIKDGKNYYAFKEFAPLNQRKVGVEDGTLGLRAEKMSEDRTSTFHPELLTDPLYRQFNREGEFGENGVENNPDTLVFYDVLNPNRVLFEDANSVYSLKNDDPSVDQGANKADSLRMSILDQINYLGLHSTAEITKNDAIYVDTAFVVRPNSGAAHYTVAEGKRELVKPQYLLAVGVEVVKPADVGCGVINRGFTRGRYLISTVKKNNALVDYLYYDKTSNIYGPIKAKKDVEWQRDYSRLIFVDAIHMGDTLYVNYGNADLKTADITLAKLEKLAKVTKNRKVQRVALDNNLHKPEVYSFRLVDATAPLNKAQNFVIESFEDDENVVAPFAGGWLKNQNGVPVLTADGDKFDNAMLNSLTLNVKKTSEEPVANEAIATTEFRVVAENGALNILNAAGKRVVVSNILGQTVANTVLSSDNATVEVPAGIVVVAVEGEAAVKAIVR